MLRALTLSLLAISLMVSFTVAVADAAVFEIEAQSLTFEPANRVIQVGDTVRWIWITGGTHTVTSGTDPSDPDAGDLFNAFLTSTLTQFEYTFNQPGIYPYHCQPHALFGMDGTILVEAPVPVEATTWGELKDKFRHAPKTP